MARKRLPGGEINQEFGQPVANQRQHPRYAGIVAKGLDIRLSRNNEIVRGELTAVALSFSGTTYQATLANAALPDRNRSRLYNSSNRTIAPTRWAFVESTPGSGVFDTVSIDPALFSSSESYLLDYVTVDTTVNDDLPVDDLREVLSLGNTKNAPDYIEGTDYRFLTAIEGPTPGDDNTNATGSVLTAITASAGNGGTGTVAHLSNTYTHEFNRAYVVRVLGAGTTPTAAAPAGSTPNRTANLLIECIPLSGGRGSLPGLTNTQANAILVELDEAVPSSLTPITVEHGITLTFGFGATNFSAGDEYTFQGNGPAVLEMDDANVADSQFPAVSAVAEVTVTGEGSITINPQSVFTGSRNKTIEVECTAASGSGASREATFRYRSDPSNRLLTGTVTVTNASTAVVGVGTLFTSELAAGDWVFFGTNPRPVRIASVTNNTAAVLATDDNNNATYDYPTQTGVRALRVRETTGSVTVLVTAPSRVSLGEGILADFDFGAGGSDIFDVGDTFSFTATVGQSLYNGKENREYTVTATTVANHTLLASYSGSTAASGFGSHTFGEGVPLVLPNNAIIHARNLSLDNRFSTSEPDSFTVGFSFENEIAWDLLFERTETIPASDILRDVTGIKTNTVGAYYVVLRRPPSSVLFVRGPAPGNASVTFNFTAGSNIIWFTTNPAVALTISYRVRGAQPAAGQTYFLTGYIKRPAEDYTRPQLFTRREEATAFLAPMTVENTAAIGNEVAWDSGGDDTLPGVVIALVRDEDEDGVVTDADFRAAIAVMAQQEGMIDMAVLGRFSVMDEARVQAIASNRPGKKTQRILYAGPPIGYPVGSETEPDTQVYFARREHQVFEASVARGCLAVTSGTSCTKTIFVDALGDGNIDRIATKVTLDGSFIALATAARVAAFPKAYEVLHNLDVVGVDEIEQIDKGTLEILYGAGIIPIESTGTSARYLAGNTTDETEASTSQLSGTVQRQRMIARLQEVTDRRSVGLAGMSPVDRLQYIQLALGSEIEAAITDKEISPYLDANGSERKFSASRDIKVLRDPANPFRTLFQASWYQFYPNELTDGTVFVDRDIP